MAGHVSFHVTYIKGKSGRKHRFHNYVFLGKMHSSDVSTGGLQEDNSSFLSYIIAYYLTRQDYLNVSSFRFSNSNSVNAITNEYFSPNNNNKRLNAPFL
jgi:predicted metalloprotease with PDZ domain